MQAHGDEGPKAGCCDDDIQERRWRDRAAWRRSVERDRKAVLEAVDRRWDGDGAVEDQAGRLSSAVRRRCVNRRLGRRLQRFG